MKKRILIIVGCAMGALCVALFLYRSILNDKISRCVDRTFDIIKAFNRLDNEAINMYIYDYTMIDSEHSFVDKENAVDILKKMNIDIISAEVYGVAINGSEVQIMVYMQIDGDEKKYNEWLVYDTSQGDIRLFELEGEKIFKDILFNRDCQLANERAHMFDFPKHMDCSYKADYNRLH